MSADLKEECHEKSNSLCNMLCICTGADTVIAQRKKIFSENREGSAELLHLQ